MSLGNELQEKHTYSKESLWHILNMLYVTAWLKKKNSYDSLCPTFAIQIAHFKVEKY